MKLMVSKKNLVYSQLEFEDIDRPTPAFVRSLAKKYCFGEAPYASGTSTCPHLKFLYDFCARTSDSPAYSLFSLSKEKIMISKQEMKVIPWRVLAQRNRTILLSDGKSFSPIYKALSKWEEEFQNRNLLPVYRSDTFPDLQSFFNYFTAMRALLSTKRVFQSRAVTIDDFIYQYVKLHPTAEGETPLPPLAYVESVIYMMPLQNLSIYRAMLLHQLFSSSQLNNLIAEKDISLPLLADIVEANQGMSSAEILELCDDIPKAWLRKLY